jgi:methylenetetrahydrofolate dehydrogenase (NADP+) / methenyltetrahydrofolate cyclohydrolase
VTASIIDGKALAETTLDRVRAAVSTLASPPLLVAVALGDDKASAAYVKRQAKIAQQCGVIYRLDGLPSHTSENELMAHLESLNRDASVTGVILQTPLPKGFDAGRCRDVLRVEKDVEGVTTMAAGRLFTQRPLAIPCTAHAALVCLKAGVGTDLRGLDVAIVGRSEIVGKPLAALLIHESATVTVCHRGTKDLAGTLRRVDAIVAAAGSPGLVTGAMIKPGAVVVDVGTNAVSTPEGTKLVGDVRFDEAKEVAKAITPVPGGVGQVTVALLMMNVVELARAKR